MLLFFLQIVISAALTLLLVTHQILSSPVPDILSSISPLVSLLQEDAAMEMAEAGDMAAAAGDMAEMAGTMTAMGQFRHL